MRWTMGVLVWVLCCAAPALNQSAEVKRTLPIPPCSKEFIAVSTQTSHSHIVSAADGTLKVTLEGSSLGWPITFSPDGSFLATADSGAAHLWDTRSGKRVRSYITSPRPAATAGSLKGVIDRVAFSPDGKRLATATSDYVPVWDVRNGLELYRTKAGHSTPGSLAFNVDGTKIAWANWNDEIRLWAYAKAKKPAILKTPSTYGHVAFRPDFNRAHVSRNETAVSIIELPTGYLLSSIVCPEFIPARAPNSANNK
jgi:WD40 repeat protein